LRWIKLVGRVEGTWVIRFNVTQKDCWYRRKWKNWGGFGGPNVIILKNPIVMSLPLARHELRHCDQWLALGPLFIPVYILFRIYFGYRYNPLEVDAREYGLRK